MNESDKRSEGLTVFLDAMLRRVEEVALQRWIALAKEGKNADEIRDTIHDWLAETSRDGLLSTISKLEEAMRASDLHANNLVGYVTKDLRREQDSGKTLDEAVQAVRMRMVEVMAGELQKIPDSVIAAMFSSYGMLVAKQQMRIEQLEKEILGGFCAHAE